MSVTDADLAAFVGASEVSDVVRAFAVATALVNDLVGDATIDEDVLDQVTLEVGHSVYRRNAEPSQAGAVSLMPDGPVPVRQPRDPREVAISLLRPFLTGVDGDDVSRQAWFA